MTSNWLAHFFILLINSPLYECTNHFVHYLISVYLSLQFGAIIYSCEYIFLFLLGKYLEWNADSEKVGICLVL